MANDRRYSKAVIILAVEARTLLNVVLDARRTKKGLINARTMFNMQHAHQKSKLPDEQAPGNSREELFVALNLMGLFHTYRSL